MAELFKFGLGPGGERSWDPQRTPRAELVTRHGNPAVVVYSLRDPKKVAPEVRQELFLALTAEIAGQLDAKGVTEDEIQRDFAARQKRRRRQQCSSLGSDRERKGLNPQPPDPKPPRVPEVAFTLDSVAVERSPPPRVRPRQSLTGLTICSVEPVPLLSLVEAKMTALPALTVNITICSAVTAPPMRSSTGTRTSELAGK